MEIDDKTYNKISSIKNKYSKGYDKKFVNNSSISKNNTMGIELYNNSLSKKNCEFIRNLYKDVNIIQISWSYGMNKSKESSEIVIIG